MSSDREASSFHTKKYLNKSGRSGQVYDENDTISEGANIIGSVRETDMTGHLMPPDKNSSSRSRSNRMARSSKVFQKPKDDQGIDGKEIANSLNRSSGVENEVAADPYAATSFEYK